MQAATITNDFTPESLNQGGGVTMPCGIKRAIVWQDLPAELQDDARLRAAQGTQAGT